MRRHSELLFSGTDRRGSSGCVLKQQLAEAFLQTRSTFYPLPSPASHAPHVSCRFVAPTVVTRRGGHDDDTFLTDNSEMLSAVFNTTMPSTRPEFWQAKFEANVARDNAVRATLLAKGWRVATVWECALRKPERAELAADMLAAWLRDGVSYLELAGSDSVLERLG